MKIQGVHLQMLSNKCTNFQKNSCTNFLEHALTKSRPQTWDRQTDTGRWTDRQTDRAKLIYPVQGLL